jgi:hypothetical protein
MDTHELNDQTDDEADVMAHRARACEMLDQITRQAKEALAERDIDLFFLIPNSGDAILAFGTPADPDDGSWNHVVEIVSDIVRRMVGLDRLICHEVTCATTRDHQRSPLDRTAGMPLPMPAPLSTLSGADQP